MLNFFGLFIMAFFSVKCLIAYPFVVVVCVCFATINK